MNTTNHGQPMADADLVESTRRQMFLDFCTLLEHNFIAYVILSGYQGYPDQIDSDVDFMVSEADFARLPTLFQQPDCIPGARLVQILRHETTACYYVFAKRVGARLAFLHPDAAASYRRRGRLWLESAHVLATRRKADAGFWIPAPGVEFEYYYVKRIDKGLVEEKHLNQLAALMREYPEACQVVLGRHVRPERVAAIAKAITEKNVGWFVKERAELCADLECSSPVEGIAGRILNRIADFRRILKRMIHPAGLVVAVLGPDGSGKTTVIEHLERELAPAFRRVRRFHLRPHFGRSGSGSVVTAPHAEPPRGWMASFAKMVLFVLDYWLGYLRLIYPAKVRSTLVIFDRYFHDMIVDPKRYRLPSGFRLARFVAKLVPQPDLWLVLDAPAEELLRRKNEINLQAAELLLFRYRDLIKSFPNAALVDTGGGIEKTVAMASARVTEFLQQRVFERLT